MTQDQIDIKTPEYVAIQFRMAGLGSRAAAYMIDRVLLLLVNIIIIVVLFSYMMGWIRCRFF